jgi:hypothetical protein
MEPSLPESKPLPEGVSEADLVDGPRVVPLKSGRAAFLQPEQMVKKVVWSDPGDVMEGTGSVELTPKPHTTAQIKRDYPAAIELALDVLSARLLGLICLVAACLIWGGIVWEPEMYRIIAGGVFSLTVFLPIMAIYWKAGMTGEGG